MEWSVSQKLIERWAAEDAELGPAGTAFHAETIQALRDARAVAPETVDARKLDQMRSIFPGARSLANSAGEVEPSPLATIGVGRPFGDEPRNRFYVVAMDIFPEYVEVSFEGDPGAAASTDWSLDVKELLAEVGSLPLHDDQDTDYRYVGPASFTLGKSWMHAVVRYTPSPPTSADGMTLGQLDGPSPFEIKLGNGAAFTRPLNLRTRALTPREVIEMMILQRITPEGPVPSIDSERHDNLRHHARPILRIAERMAEANLIDNQDPLLSELEQAQACPPADLERHLLVPVPDTSASDGPARLLRVIPVSADISPVPGHQVALRWTAIWSDRISFLVSGADAPVPLRWRVSDKVRGRRAAFPHCGDEPFVDYHIVTAYGRPPPDAHSLTIAVDGGGNEVSMAVDLQPDPGDRDPPR